MSALGFVVVLTASAAAAAPPLVPREVLFGNPVRQTPTVSPDGRRMAWLAPDERGVLNVWVSTVGQEDERPVTREPRRGIFVYHWAQDSRHILYEQDSDGDENVHVYAVTLDTAAVRDLTPYPGVKALGVQTSPRRPGEILVSMNRRDPRVFDVYRVDLSTGAATLEAENPGDVLSWTTDNALVVRAATVFDAETAETRLRLRDGPGQPWRTVQTWPFERSGMFGQVNGGSVVAAFAADGRSLFVVSGHGSDTLRVVRLDAGDGRQLEVVAEDPRSDPAADYNGADYKPLVLTHPDTGELQAVGFEQLQLDWKFLDPALEKDFRRMRKGLEGDLRVVSRDRRGRVWIVRHEVDDRSPRYFVYEPEEDRTVPLFVEHPDLDRHTLARVKPIMIRARDGIELPAYLTLPPGMEPKGLPLVIVPHGGPWARDSWGFDSLVQFLANRGYAALKVNYRGSTGFGLRFLNAGNGQFGLGMLDDLIDAVRWAVSEGIADPKRVAILGGSAGGYAVLRALTEHPELFACGVDLVGPSDLQTLFASMPAYWGPVKTRWRRRIGDVERDAALNRRLSPLYHVERAQAPLLIGQGANDPRVKIEQSDRIVAAWRAKGIPVTYVVYPDEGHGFARPENNLDFFGRAEEFLARYLRGRAEPWKPVAGSTATVR